MNKIKNRRNKKKWRGCRVIGKRQRMKGIRTRAHARTHLESKERIEANSCEILERERKREEEEEEEQRRESKGITPITKILVFLLSLFFLLIKLFWPLWKINIEGFSYYLLFINCFGFYEEKKVLENFLYYLLFIIYFSSMEHILIMWMRKQKQ